MAIPMGTVVTVCMVTGVIVANKLPDGALNTRVPRPLLTAVGSVCIAAGAWNILWYALQNITQFWGQMAFGSGLVLCAVGVLLVLPPQRVPARLENARHVLVTLLACFAAYYGYTIYNL